MKKVGMVFYGRSTSLEQILDISDINRKRNLLSDYFIRNAFSSDISFKNNADKLSQYTIMFEELLINANLNDIQKLEVQFIK